MGVSFTNQKKQNTNVDLLNRDNLLTNVAFSRESLLLWANLGHFGVLFTQMSPLLTPQGDIFPQNALLTDLAMGVSFIIQKK